MKRWHTEEVLMRRRWREEIRKHTDQDLGYVRDGCHCLRGKGFMRKRRPYESHPSSSCATCARERDYKRQEKRRERRWHRRVIAEELVQ